MSAQPFFLLALEPVGATLIIPSRAGSLAISTLEHEGQMWTRVASQLHGVRHYSEDLPNEVAARKFCIDVGVA